MTHHTSSSSGPTDLEWMLAELERAGFDRKARERLLHLLAQIMDGQGLKRAEVKQALRTHIAGTLLQSCSATEARRRLPELLTCSKRTAERCVSLALRQRTARLWGFEGGGDAAQ